MGLKITNNTVSEWATYRDDKYTWSMSLIQYKYKQSTVNTIKQMCLMDMKNTHCVILLYNKVCEGSNQTKKLQEFIHKRILLPGEASL